MNTYQKIGYDYALSGNHSDGNIDVAEVIGSQDDSVFDTQIQAVVSLYDEMLKRNDDEIKQQKITDKELCGGQLLVGIRDILFGMIFLLLNVSIAVFLIDRIINVGGLYRYYFALFSPVLMVFISYMVTFIIPGGVLSIESEVYNKIIYIYIGVSAVLVIMVFMAVKYADVILYLFSLLYPVYLMARVFMANVYLLRINRCLELETTGNEIKKKKIDLVSELMSKKTAAIQKEYENKADFWVGYGIGKSIK